MYKPISRRKLLSLAGSIGIIYLSGCAAPSAENPRKETAPQTIEKPGDILVVPDGEVVDLRETTDSPYEAVEFEVDGTLTIGSDDSLQLTPVQ